jgi:hypothetical protein
MFAPPFKLLDLDFLGYLLVTTGTHRLAFKQKR